ncbi:porin [Microvirga roseola]|uniref:porin n=1 Tax=Microvirga roseola TaxID=2883126 RepID=UPI001E4B82B7|nr:porin [Microvirga roseola]
MKLAKSLFLGSAAALATVAGAQAADLPARAVAPAVEYVRVCNTYGAGFFYIPGTETCLRVGGRVRADYIYGETFDRSDDAFNFFVRGRVQLDARTATAYGLLRTLVRMEMNRTAGGSTSANIAQAFVQFGGLTAGRVTSFFANGDLPTGHMGTLRFYDAPDVDLLAYTFSFGNGFSATLSLEDQLESRVNGALAFVPGLGNALVYAGQRAPNLVGNVKYTGTWGTAQLAGAVGQIRSDNFVTLPGGTVVIPDTEYGFAVSGSVGINLPMLGAGDALWLNATYANGALAYLGFGEGAGAGTISYGVANAYVNPITGDIERGHGWSIAGGLRHYWTPQIRQNVFGSYASVEYGAGVAPSADFREWRVGTNVFWQPVAGLDIGVEVLYANIDSDGFTPAGVENDDFSGRLRIQRDF